MAQAKISQLGAAGGLSGEEQLEVIRPKLGGGFENLSAYVQELLGKSAFEVAQDNGFTGTEQEWLQTLIGPEGPRGYSAFNVAVDNGFVGTEQEWLDALVGPQGEQGIQGVKGDQGDKGDRGYSAFELAVQNGFTGTEAEWLDHLEGDDAYTLAVAEGFTGTRQEWLDSLVGPQGEIGPEGPQGDSAYQVAVANGFEGTHAAWLASLEGPEGKSAYELAVANGYVGTEEEWLAEVSGPRGYSAYEVAVAEGFQGTMDEWLVSLRGRPGPGLRILGTFESTADLPMTENDPGDAYIIDLTMWVWHGTGWEPVGQMGVSGHSAYQVALENGFQGTVQQWLESLEGKSAFEVAVGDGFVGDTSDWLASLTGPQGDLGPVGPEGPVGPQGPISPAIALLGERTTVDELPTDAAAGDAYVVGTDVHVWTGDSWYNAGQIQGPIGPEGPQGIQGPQGDQGEKGDSNYQIAVANGFTGTVIEWLDSLKGEQGVAGETAYEIAVREGYAGTETEWLASLKGETGDTGTQGLKGDPGADLMITGKVATMAELPTLTASDYAAYLVGEELYVWVGDTWINAGRVTGPSAYEVALLNGFTGTDDVWLESLKGASAFQVAVDAGFNGTEQEWLDTLRGAEGPEGPEGPVGPEGPEGPVGAPGANLNLLGEVNDITELPPTGEIGDGYLIGQDLYGWDGSDWRNYGPVKGPQGDQGEQGDSAYAVAVATGFVGTEAEWLESLQGPAGDDAYEVAVSQGFVGTKQEWLDSLVGPEGPVGENATAINLLGTLATTADLPTTGTAGDAYIIDSNVHVYTGTEWYNAGPIQGPQGPRGYSAYHTAVTYGFVGDEQAYLDSLKGAPGQSAYELAVAAGFTGTEAEWVDSLKGEGGDSAYQLAVDQGFTGTIVEWLDSLKGDTGASLYDIAVTQGFTGTEQEFLDSMVGPQGPQGDVGPQGDPGAHLNIVGVVATAAELPTTGTVGEGYLVGDNLYAWINDAWVDTGTVRGPAGPEGPQGATGSSAYQAAVAAGFTGTEAEWLASLEGDSAYQIAVTNGFTGTEAEWLTHLEGDGAYTIAVANGFTGTQQEWLDSLHGTDGASAYELAIANGFTGTQQQWLDSLKGAQGDPGAQLMIMDTLTSVSDLPTTGTAGEGYLIDGDLYGWVGSGWKNLGTVQGPQGIDGRSAYEVAVANGYEGNEYEWLLSIEGNRWISHPYDPNSVVGNVGDFAINSVTNQWFQKTSEFTWSSMGYLGGGNVWEAPVDGQQYVRQDGTWVLITADVEEAPIDGQQYVRVDGTWAIITAEVEEVPTTDPTAQYVRRGDGTWTTLDMADATVDMQPNTTVDNKAVSPVALETFLLDQLGVYYDETTGDWVNDEGTIAPVA